MAAAATLTIWIRSPFAGWAYSIAVFTLAAVIFLQSGFAAVTKPTSNALPRAGNWLTGAIITSIVLWGFVQLALGGTVYRKASVDTSLRVGAEAATLLASVVVFRDARIRRAFLAGFVWFAFAVSVIAVLAYYTSPGEIMWLFPSPYPDNWGPFLSRNDFAAFLELSYPIALWHALTRGYTGKAQIGKLLPIGFPIWTPAWMLAAGLASASRAGSLFLIAETLVLLGFVGRSNLSRAGLSAAGRFFAFVVLSVAVAGAGTLLGRLRDPHPLLYRDQIAASTIRMIRDRPWSGFGLGTFRHVYPQYATFDAGTVVEHVHNDWLEWAADGGIPYALLWCALAGFTGRQALRSRLGIGVVSVFLHGLVDYPFARFGITAWTFALMGAVLAEGERTTSPRALT